MKLIIDRFEADYAVVELPDRSMVDMPRKLFEEGKEGAVYTLLKDKSETANRENSIQSKFDRLKMK